MANTFKLKTKAGVTTLATVYTVPASTTSIVLGLVIGNTTGSAITSTITVSSDTSDTETNADVELLTTGAIPANSSIDVLSGSKLVLQTTDLLKVYGTGAVDVALSIMEIT
ncbi:MAG: hypothetical protein QGH83_00880 [Candidatus Pacebacteria bacterium]|jgi:hypothetical protein|nr:hypothetical protein [Candidatus Paceibacterota bacterium]|tara:strand:- start:422 stop:754 length:333 start_codon:yes stop_codon:yes gene_type:complete